MDMEKNRPLAAQQQNEPKPPAIASENSGSTVPPGRPCVYILRCKDGTLYTGWTNNFAKRLKTHNSGKGAKYTRGRRPVMAVYLEYLPDKSAAVKREAAIKKLPLKKKQQLIASSSNQLKQEP